MKVDKERAEALLHLVRKLRKKYPEVQTVEFEYSGSGDSGDTMSLILMDKTGAVIEDYCNEKDQDIIRGLEDRLYDFVPCGYENNEGGYGTVTLDVVKMFIKNDHYDYVTSEEYNPTSYDIAETIEEEGL